MTTLKVGALRMLLAGAVIALAGCAKETCQDYCKKDAKRQLQETYGVPAVEQFREPYEMLVNQCLPLCEANKKFQQTPGARPL